MEKTKARGRLKVCVGCVSLLRNEESSEHYL